MRPSAIDLVRTTSFRLALLYVALFAASALALFAVIYWAATANIGQQIDGALDAERTALLAQGGDTAALAAAVAERVGHSANPFRYAVLDKSGDRLAGDLPPGVRRAGYQDFELSVDSRESHGEVERRVFRGLGGTLPDGGFLLVAEDAESLDEAREVIAGAFAWGAGATLLLAVLGGALMSAGVLRRVETINRASERIMAGELSRRLPVRSARRGDEFDRLAINLNRMLERIEHLVDGLRQVSTDIAHDLRSPLGRLRRTLETARDAAPAEAPPEHLAAIDRGIAEADGLLATFGALLRIAQIEAGAARRGFGAVDLSQVLDATIEVYGPAAEEKQQTLAARLIPGVTVQGDRTLLTQMIANLVENAIRHCPVGARIEVAAAAAASGRGPAVTVGDNGPGIPAGEQANVFRRFYRLETSRTTPGNGLGLSLVAAVAQLHGIAVELADNAPGLRVILQFPGPTVFAP